MKWLADIYRWQMSTTLAIQLQYRAGLAIWMIEVVLEPVIYLVVWQAAVGGGEIAGYAARDFAAYYLMMMIVTHLTQMWHMWEFEWRIREGQFNRLLLLPIHPIHGDIASNLTYKALMMIVVVPAVIFLALVFQPVFTPPAWSVAAFIPAVMLAAALAFVLGWVVAMAAFWTVRITAINQMYFLAMLFFSGFIAPLDVLPTFLQSIAGVLPFQWIYAFPIELSLGRLSVDEAVLGFAMQGAWLAVSVGLLLIIWKQAIRRYGAVGG
ncbi:MAG: ABC transporter permease [Chloroflexota bacterium]